MRLFLLLLLAISPAWAQSSRVVKLVEGLDHPWSVAFLPDGRLLVTERPGRLRIVEEGKLLPAPVSGLPEIAEHGQGGLFDVVLHPQFSRNSLVYLSYAGRGDDGVGTELLSAKFANSRLEDVQVLFRQSPKGRSGNHFGGRLAFDPAGYLYLTPLHRGGRPRSQRAADHS